jgi:hypothetical protein
MVVRLAAVGAAFTLALCAGCRDGASPAVADLGPRVSAWVPDSAAVLGHAYYSGFATATHAVVSDGLRWAATWNQFWGTLEPKPPASSVDFATERVLLVALGMRFSGGYDIAVDSVVGYQGGTTVYLTGRSPGQGCIVTGALSAPAQLVRVPRPPEPVTFQQRDVVTPCTCPACAAPIDRRG